MPDMQEDITRLKNSIDEAMLKQELRHKKDEESLDAIYKALLILRTRKPDERSELARRYAVTITELEKVYAYFQVYVMGSNNDFIKVLTNKKEED